MSRENLSRRSFAIGAAAAVASLGLAACSPKTDDSGSQSAASGMPESWDYEADVVIVGSGGAGHMAACAAHEEGSSCLVLEKDSTVGGDTFVCGGITIGPWPAKTKEDSGMDDSPELWLEDQKKSYEFSQRKLNGEDMPGDLSFIERFAEIMPGTFEWMRDTAGVEWQTINYTQDGFTPQPSWDTVFPRDWNPSTGVIPPLKALVEGYEDVEVVTETEAIDLIMDASGRAVGVWALNARGERVCAKAKKAVVVATGAFSSNRDMVAKYLGASLVAVPTTSCATNTGDGHKMVERAGGALRDMGLGAHWSPNNLSGSPSYMTSMAMYGNPVIYGSYMPGILVNYDGVRYCNENLGYSLTGYHTHQQRFHIGWYVVDSAHSALVIPEDLSTEIVAVADTVEELGHRMQVNAEAFAAEVAKYNGYVDAGADPDFGKALDGCAKIEAAPFYAVPIYPMPYQTYGGIAVDVDGHVLADDGAAIPGLYAAGICTGSFAAQAGLFYLGGVSQSLAFGRQAGKNAAAEEAWA